MPRCEATCNWVDDPQCENSAKVEIDGIKLCLVHSGTMATRKLIQMGKAKKLEGSYYKSPLCGMQ
jgi:hypothetical protein